MWRLTGLFTAAALGATLAVAPGPLPKVPEMGDDLDAWTKSAVSAFAAGRESNYTGVVANADNRKKIESVYRTQLDNVDRLKQWVSAWKKYPYSIRNTSGLMFYLQRVTELVGIADAGAEGRACTTQGHELQNRLFKYEMDLGLWYDSASPTTSARRG